MIHSGIAWIEFLNCSDVLGNILCHIRDGDLKGAQLLWLRHEVLYIHLKDMWNKVNGITKRKKKKKAIILLYIQYMHSKIQSYKSLYV